MQSLAQRPNLSKTIADRVRQMIFDGRLSEHQRLNEVHLAAELGISRTPLREALHALSGEGALRSEPRRGYFVQPLTADEFRALYPIRALLDPEALRLAGLPGAGRIRELDRLNRALDRASTPDEAIDADDRWHLALLRHCPNPVMIELIESFMRRTRRYELAYLRETRHRALATEEHQAVIDALGRGDLDGACTALKRNLTSGTAPILDWLTTRRP